MSYNQRSNRSTPDLTEEFMQLIRQGTPYVWMLRINQTEYEAIEETLQHQGADTDPLLTAIYVAESYKRVGDVASWFSFDAESVWHALPIDEETFVYHAAQKTRWQDSLQVLGGLCIHRELEKADDKLLQQLCRIYNGDESVSLDDLGDANRAVAFQESISSGHSLRHYFDAILSGKAVFANDDAEGQRLIQNIKAANKAAQYDKFEAEWLIYYTAYNNRMTRSLQLRLKTEAKNGGYRQYLSYDWLAEHGVQHPESVSRLGIYLQFRDGKRSHTTQPVLYFSNTGSRDVGFLATSDVETIVCGDVPLQFSKVDLWIQYGEERKKIQAFDWDDRLQVYKVPHTEGRWSSRRRPRATTAVIFSTKYHIKERELKNQIVEVPFTDHQEQGDVMCWCPIGESVTLVDEHGGNAKTFYNRSDSYQVVVKRYMDTIKYEDGLYVTYQYTDIEEGEVGEDDYEIKQVRLLFGRDGVKVRKFKSKDKDEWEWVDDFKLEFAQDTSRYQLWTGSNEPHQGRIKIRITPQNHVVSTYTVYYVPFLPTQEDDQPIRRNFADGEIQFNVDGIPAIPNDYQENHQILQDSVKVVLPSEKARQRVLLEIYRPILLRELYQNGKLIKYYKEHEKIKIPMIVCEQFRIREFSRQGVREYDCAAQKNNYSGFPKIPGTKDLTSCVTADEKNWPKNLVFYLTKGAIETGMGWNYASQPVPAKLGDKYDIVFQSLKDNPSPTEYLQPGLRQMNASPFAMGPFGQPKKQVTPPRDYASIFETIVEHKVYFLIFEPMCSVVKRGSLVEDIIKPLLEKRQGKLTKEDEDGLDRFVAEFQMDSDWREMARDKGSKI